MKNKEREYKRPVCEKCIYAILFRRCPCGWSKSNAACLELYRDVDDFVQMVKEKWGKRDE